MGLSHFTNCVGGAYIRAGLEPYLTKLESGFVNWPNSYKITAFFLTIDGGNAMAALKVGVVMGSQSDWPVMEHAVKQLEAFGVAVEARVVSAHRTPDLLFEYAEKARDQGIACIISAAHHCLNHRRESG